MTLPVHLRLRGAHSEAMTRRALRAVLNAAHILGLATGAHLSKLRGLRDSVAEINARLQEAEVNARIGWELLELQSERFRKLPEKHRPHFSPAARFRLLEMKSLMGWSRDLAANAFLVCANTLSNWERSADPNAMTVGSTIKPTPPLRRFADVGRRVVQMMVRLGVGGQDMIAAVLARAGWKLAPHTVRRIAAESPIGPAAPPPQAKRGHPVIARFVHHTWMMDATVVKSFFGLFAFHVVGVFDAFSRLPFALQVFAAKPKVAELARLLRRAVSAFRAPKYLITDLEFRAKLFRRTVARLGVIQRFASKDNIYATARLERFWRTLKDSARLRLLRPQTREDLERRLEVALTHYVVFRPHQGLRGATPAEAFLGIEPASARAVPPPRGRPGEAPHELPFTVAFLDPTNRRFPILTKAA